MDRLSKDGRAVQAAYRSVVALNGLSDASYEGGEHMLDEDALMDVSQGASMLLAQSAEKLVDDTIASIDVDMHEVMDALNYVITALDDLEMQIESVDYELCWYRGQSCLTPQQQLVEVEQDIEHIMEKIGSLNPKPI